MLFVNIVAILRFSSLAHGGAVAAEAGESRSMSPWPKHRVSSSLQLPPGPWATVLDCLCEQFPHISRAEWLGRMERGLVLDEAGQPIGPHTAHRAELKVRYFREVKDEAVIPFTETILYADSNIVVADKPHFLPVTPAGQYVEQTLLARLIERLDNPDLAPLHRIDRGTAGLVLFSANAANRAQYHALFRERRVSKEYQALAPALPEQQFPLVRRSRLEHGEPFFRMQEVAGTPNSETHVDVLERGATHWRYALTPVTGKQHQLRVHMAALGAPILNDDFYPVLDKQDASDFRHPLQLLAASLAFVDPITGKALRFVSELRLQAMA
jgi:tRNA pseudouridine32 synthase/23S rRNA pseudouridine746 synthase